VAPLTNKVARLIGTLHGPAPITASLSSAGGYIEDAAVQVNGSGMAVVRDAFALSGGGQRAMSGRMAGQGRVSVIGDV
jgi:hypothetical protein